MTTLMEEEQRRRKRRTLTTSVIVIFVLGVVGLVTFENTSEKPTVSTTTFQIKKQKFTPSSNYEEENTIENDQPGVERASLPSQEIETPAEDAQPNTKEASLPPSKEIEKIETEEPLPTTIEPNEMKTLPSCSESLTQLCTDEEKSLTVQMMAVPHSASSSVDGLMKARERAWPTTNVTTHQNRGFNCSGSVTSQSCGAEHDDLVSCILGKLKYNGKTHTPYNSLKSKYPDRVLFTILRDPGQHVLSHYNMRRTWDKQFTVQYPLLDLLNISVTEWVEKAWWRQNLYTKSLSTTTQLLWASLRTNVKATDSSFAFTKEKSDAENELGENSTWLTEALDHLKAMPFFGLHHRLTETFELIGFHLCVPTSMKARATKKARHVDSKLNTLVKQYYALDGLLLREAEPLFDELVADMHRKKSQGMLCDLGKVLGESESFGLQCST